MEDSPRQAAGSFKKARVYILLAVFVLANGVLFSAASARDMRRQRMSMTAKDVVLTPEDLKWGPAPDALPAGAEVAVLEGDPTKPGPYTMRLKMPADYKIPPHRHSSPERVTVISGKFNVAKGEKADPEMKGTVLPPGSFFMMAPKSAHYAWASEETIIQLHGRGPWQINYINPGDDPRKKAK